MHEQERTFGIPVTTVSIFYRAKINLMDGKNAIVGEHTEVQVDSLVVFCTINTRAGRLLQRKGPRVKRGVGVSRSWRCKGKDRQQTAREQD